ncbi:sulfite exporter TauE/SafE family protein [Gammaproteobacteria bacterium]|nr:sulfite exporter TauE/SafE family protein [Gammaproteobacteria bacterium]
MDTLVYSVLFGLGFAGGFFSGLLGIGGGIIMVPLLLYIPPAFGLAAMSMKVVAGITAVQSFVGTISGAAGHNRYRRIHRGLALSVGLPMAIASLAGSIASSYVSNELMLMVFAGMALVAATLMFLPLAESTMDESVQQVEFNRTAAILIGVVIGGLAGIIGQGGAFLYIPALLYILRVPTRITIGSSLAIGIASSASVLLGRIGTDQVPWLWATVLVLGVVIGAQLGSMLSQYTPKLVLRRILGVVITASAARIWWELL